MMCQICWLAYSCALGLLSNWDSCVKYICTVFHLCPFLFTILFWFLGRSFWAKKLFAFCYVFVSDFLNLHISKVNKKSKRKVAASSYLVWLRFTSLAFSFAHFICVLWAPIETLFVNRRENKNPFLHFFFFWAGAFQFSHKLCTF